MSEYTQQETFPSVQRYVFQIAKHWKKDLSKHSQSSSFLWQIIFSTRITRETILIAFNDISINAFIKNPLNAYNRWPTLIRIRVQNPQSAYFLIFPFVFLLELKMINCGRKRTTVYIETLPPQLKRPCSSAQILFSDLTSRKEQAI